MLPKQHRLPLRTELKRVQKEGKLIHGPLFSLLISHQPKDTSEVSPLRFGGIPSTSEVRRNKPPRFAFIISSKVHKKAVKRNKAKRLLGEAIQSLLPKIKSGFDVVFLVKKAIVDKNLSEIKRELERTFRHAGLISQQSSKIAI